MDKNDIIRTAKIDAETLLANADRVPESRNMARFKQSVGDAMRFFEIAVREASDKPELVENDGS